MIMSFTGIKDIDSQILYYFNIEDIINLLDSNQRDK